jgi:outer membrane protein assembly factor BamA
VDVIGDPRLLPADELVNSGGLPFLVEVGGDRMYLVQSELVFPFTQQAELAAFVDMGDSLFEDTSIGLDTLRVSAGVELRFHLPIFPVPLRLIYGVPVQKITGDRTSNFTFSIGRSF